MTLPSLWCGTPPPPKQPEQKSFSSKATFSSRRQHYVELTMFGAAVSMYGFYFLFWNILSSIIALMVKLLISHWLGLLEAVFSALWRQQISSNCCAGISTFPFSASPRAPSYRHPSGSLSLSHSDSWQGYGVSSGEFKNRATDYNLPHTSYMFIKQTCFHVLMFWPCFLINSHWEYCANVFSIVTYFLCDSVLKWHNWVWCSRVTNVVLEPEIVPLF